MLSLLFPVLIFWGQVPHSAEMAELSKSVGGLEVREEGTKKTRCQEWVPAGWEWMVWFGWWWCWCWCWILVVMIIFFNVPLRLLSSLRLVFFLWQQDTYYIITLVTIIVPLWLWSSWPGKWSSPTWFSIWTWPRRGWLPRRTVRTPKGPWGDAPGVTIGHPWRRMTGWYPYDLGNTPYLGVGGFSEGGSTTNQLRCEHASWLISCQHGCWFFSHILFDFETLVISIR